MFNAFRVVKYLNYIHKYFFEKSPVFDAAAELALRMGLPAEDLLTEEELLDCYRQYERLIHFLSLESSEADVKVKHHEN